ncbi:ATP-binding cassette domain-containing protein [Dactylosporangium sp. CA-139066]|uniref:ATP-binding cassette domain-containing protein n=1 Tax=Dactylosporangium sp. CA-139066 TaxID=3239930 RepID=UPI003D8F5880
MSGIAVDIHALTHRYGANTVLSNVTLHVARGARHAIIGPNGAGKTTLLGLIAGSTRPTSGTITFDGKSVTRLPMHRRARLGMSRTWQHPAIIGTLPAIDNVALAIRSPRLRTARAAAMECLERAGLGGLAAVPAGGLPYAQRRVLELVTALAGCPRLLILDEPSAGLDEHAAADLLKRLLAVSPEVTVVLADHSHSLVATLADTATVLDGGRSTFTGPPGRALRHPSLGTSNSDRTPTPASVANVRHSARPILQASNLDSGYFGHPVLRRLHLEIAPGEIVAIAGTDGSGRTTLVNTLAGLHAVGPSSRITLDGADITNIGPAGRAQRGISTVLQGRPPIPSITVDDQLRLVMNPSAALANAFELAPWLAGRGHQLVRTLSGGERQLLAIACAVARTPKLLILDEPAEGLAATAVEQLGRLFERLAAQQIAIVFTEPPVGRLRDWSTRRMFLREGRAAAA